MRKKNNRVSVHQNKFISMQLGLFPVSPFSPDAPDLQPEGVDGPDEEQLLFLGTWQQSRKLGVFAIGPQQGFEPKGFL